MSFSIISRYKAHFLCLFVLFQFLIAEKGKSDQTNASNLDASLAQGQVHWADLDGDGRQDIFWQALSPEQTHYIVRQSDHRFQLAKRIPKEEVISWPLELSAKQSILPWHLGLLWDASSHRLVWGDFNGDGRQDVLLQGHRAEHGFAMAWADKEGQFQHLAQQFDPHYLDINWSTQHYQIISADLNGDKQDDLLLLAKAQGVLSYILYARDGVFLQRDQSFSVPDDWQQATLRKEDVDGDGLIELWIEYADGRIHVVFSVHAAEIERLLALRQTTKQAPPKPSVPVVAASQSEVSTAQSTSKLRSDNHRALPIPSLVGGTNGEFRVDESGAATYRIPLILPRGSGGTTPEVALRYSSQTRHGLMGVGWSLQGLSEVTRCRQTLEQDGAVTAIRLNNDDRFCLDGQRLILVAGAYYGADQAEYRTEIDSFSRIISYGRSGDGPAYFRVWRQDGSIAEYGATVDSFIEAKGLATALVWALSKTTDSVGNQIKYAYSEDTAPSTAVDYRVAYINYTFRQGQSHHVQFDYDIRPDSLLFYVAGHARKINHRLTRVSVSALEGPVRKYLFSYRSATATGHSLLSAVMECNAYNDRCFPATEFTWQQRQSGLQTSATPTGQPDHGEDAVRKAFVADLNGDARMDLLTVVDDRYLVYIATATGFEPPRLTSLHYHEHARLLDRKGDGVVELMIPEFIKGDTRWRGHRWTGGGFIGQELLSHGSMNDTAKQYPFDVNGDGLMDWVKVERNGWVAINRSGHFDEPRELPFIIHSYPDEVKKVYVHGASTQPYDMNGDGIADVLMAVTFRKIDAEGEEVLWTDWLLFIGNGQSYEETANFGRANEDSRPQLLDANGDGLSDVVIVAPNSQASYFLNTGKDFKKINLGSLPNAKYLQAWDVNGDGLSDLWYPDKGTWRVRYAITQGYYGSDFSAAENTGFPATDLDRDRYKLSDIDGDGQTDLLVADRGVWWVHFHKGSGQHESITDIMTGLGMATHVRYALMTDSNVYTPAPEIMEALRFGRGSPVMRLNAAPIPIVAEVSSSAPTAHDTMPGQVDSKALQRVLYRYTGAYMQGGGRGFLGFDQLITYDPARLITTITDYHHEFPLIGRPRHTVVKSYGDMLLKEGWHTWGVQTTYNGKSRYPVLLKSEEKFYDNGAMTHTITTHNDYDDEDKEYGHPTHIKVVTREQDGSWYETQNHNRYEHKVTATLWHLARLAHTQVIHRRPQQPDQVRNSIFGYHNTTGLLTSETVEPNDPSVRVSTHYEHDKYGNRTRIIQEASGTQPRITTLTYDALGRYAISKQNALGHQEITQYRSDFDVPETHQGPNQNAPTQRWYYDDLGRVSATQETGKQMRRIQYDWCRPCVLVDVIYTVTESQQGMPTKKSYLDMLGRVRREAVEGFDGRFIIVDKEYDRLGRIKRVSVPYYEGEIAHWNYYQYDQMDRMRMLSDAKGEQTRFSYTNLATSIVNPKGQHQVERKNALGERIAITDALGGVTRYYYDASGNVQSIVDPAGHTVRMTYDRVGRKVRMEDPSMGVINYRYNGLGELLEQRHESGVTTLFAYDKLGRLVERKEKTATGELESEAYWNYDTANYGKGLLAEEGDRVSGFKRRYRYDYLSRTEGSITSIAGRDYEERTVYDPTYGYLKQQKDASGGVIDYRYNPYGYRQQVVDMQEQTETVLWTLQTQTARQQWQRATLGNGLAMQRMYEAETGWLLEMETPGSANQPFIQHWQYTYDTLGNLTSRTDTRTVKQSTIETFAYDGANRLTEVNTAGKPSLRLSYDAVGNIVEKSDVGRYRYGEQGASPYAVTSIIGPQPSSYRYDRQGNRIEAPQQYVAYTAFNQPKRVMTSKAETRFSYDPARQRYHRWDRDDKGQSVDTFYVGNVEFVQRANRAMEIRRYIANVAMIQQTSDQPVKRAIYYFHWDHLGSLEAISDQRAQVVERRRFSVFGDLLSAKIEQTAKQTSMLTPRGYTGHEHVESAGLIHMNGRMYDPKTGRFLSADPVVQAPGDSQHLNRYSYVLNNPLRYTDPSGYFIDDVFDSIGDFLGKHWRSILSIAINMIPGTQLWQAMLTGFISGAIASGDLQGGLIGALSSGAFFAIGAGFEGDLVQGGGFLSSGLNLSSYISKAVLHGIVGGIMHELQGGKFGHGFAAAFVTQAASAGINQLGGPRFSPERIIAAAVVGGTASSLSGGKFANGAVTAAFSRSFGEMARHNAAARQGTGAQDAFSPLGDIVGKIWALPNTIVGMIYGGVGHVAGLMMGTDPSISIGHNAIQFINNPLIADGQALTLGNTILYGDGASPSVNQAYGDPTVNIGLHEEAHTYQYQVLGPLYVPAYMLNGGFSGPLGNPFEQAAQQYGRGKRGWWPW